MTENQIAVAMEKYGRQIPAKGESSNLKKKMIVADDGCMDGLMNLRMKSKWVAFLLAFFLGGFGAGRFYLGDTKIAILRIVASVLTGALSFIPILGLIVAIASMIWLIAEWFLCFNRAKILNFETLSNYLSSHTKIAGATV